MHEPSARRAVIKFTIALVATGLLFGAPFVVSGDTVPTVALLLATFVGLPLTIVLYKDLAHKLGSVESAHSRVFARILAVPIVILGATSMLIGVAVILWIAYNLFVERQPQFRAGRIALPILCIGFGWVCLRYPLSRKDL